MGRAAEDTGQLAETWAPSPGHTSLFLVTGLPFPFHVRSEQRKGLLPGLRDQESSPPSRPPHGAR